MGCQCLPWHQVISVQHEAPLEGKGDSGLNPTPVSDTFLMWLLSVLFPALPRPRAHGLSAPGPFCLQPVGCPAALLCLGPESKPGWPLASARGSLTAEISALFWSPGSQCPSSLPCLLERASPGARNEPRGWWERAGQETALGRNLDFAVKVTGHPQSWGWGFGEDRSSLGGGTGSH